MDESQFQTQFHLSLDPQQAAAVRAVDGPVLLLAVPGSGKTTALVTRLGYLVYVRGVPPERILTMTYTTAAARDMERRFTAQFGGAQAERLEFRTINGVCSRIIRHYEQRMGRRAFTLLEDAGRQAALLGEIYRSQTRDFASESTIRAIQTAVTYAKNSMLSEEELKKVEVEGVDFPPLFQAYRRAMQERRLMDYDDQMVYAHQILRQYPQILQAFQRRYQYFCVDEAQDTSKIQHAIIRLLAGESRNLFMVGDEDQSIYGFRAACPEALTSFEADYPGAAVLYLEQNYRSTSQIVAAADRFIQQNRTRRPKRMRAVRGGGPELKELRLHDRHRQYQYLAKVAEDCQVETAVLYRDNDSALPLIDLLDRAGTPYRCRQVDSSFFTHWIVRDITNIIRFAQDPRDGGLFLDIYYKLGAGISRAAAEEAIAESGATGQTILACLADCSSASPWTRKQCRGLQTHLDHLLGERADRAVYRIVHFMGYGEFLERRGADSNKAQILEALGGSQPNPGLLLDRLETLEQVVRSGSTDPDCPFILSTIHSSKGLEYQRVILMDVADGLLPKSPPPGDKASPEELAAFEEERRLFYVGMTRAKQELWVVRFGNPDLASAFSSFLFPDKEKPGQKTSNPQKQAAPPPKKAPDPKQIAVLAKDYIPGVRLNHMRFGPGTLIDRSGDLVTVRFEDGGEKRFLLSIGLKQEQFRLL